MIKIKLKELLVKKGKSRYWLEKETGISFRTISNLYFNTCTGIQFETLEKICKALDCTVNDIIQFK